MKELRHCTVLKHQVWLPYWLISPVVLNWNLQTGARKVESIKLLRVVNSKHMSIQGSLPIHFSLFSNGVHHSVIQPSRSHTLVYVSFLPSPAHPRTSAGRRVNLQWAESAGKKPPEAGVALWTACSSRWVPVQGSRRGNLLFWQQSVIRLALWVHEIVSVSYPHICDFLESCGHWRHHFPAECHPFPGCCHSVSCLMQRQVGDHKIGWLELLRSF